MQPYALIIPESYDGSRPVRLDLVLHGRGATLNEVSFISGHESATPLPATQDFIQLEVFGRGNNAYRWAGEADVFEALDSVEKRYRIDPARIVLRGFSMGGAGTWHIGLHHPARWVAMEAGAGFTETKRYAKLKEIPPYQEATLHIYDAVDYSLNAVNLPVVGYGGEIDPQLQGSTNIREQLTREGFHFRHEGLNWFGTDLQSIFLVGPQTAHKFHPESKQTSDEFINRAVAKGKEERPEHIRFVTYTPRYKGADRLGDGGVDGPALGVGQRVQDEGVLAADEVRSDVGLLVVAELHEGDGAAADHLLGGVPQVRLQQDEWGPAALADLRQLFQVASLQALLAQRHEHGRGGLLEGGQPPRHALHGQVGQQFRARRARAEVQGETGEIAGAAPLAGGAQPLQRVHEGDQAEEAVPHLVLVLVVEQVVRDPVAFVPAEAGGVVCLAHQDAQSRAQPGHRDVVAEGAAQLGEDAGVDGAIGAARLGAVAVDRLDQRVHQLVGAQPADDAALGHPAGQQLDVDGHSGGLGEDGQLPAHQGLRQIDDDHRPVLERGGPEDGEEALAAALAAAEDVQAPDVGAEGQRTPRVQAADPLLLPALVVGAGAAATSARRTGSAAPGRPVGW